MHSLAVKEHEQPASLDLASNQALSTQIKRAWFEASLDHEPIIYYRGSNLQ